MKKKISIIGSTGSIGTSTLEVLRQHRDKYELESLSVCSNTELLEEQIREFKPNYISVYDEKAGALLKQKEKTLDVKVFTGPDALLEQIHSDKADIYIFGLSGSKGIYPLLEALKKGVRVAIANKEPLVIAGKLVRELAEKHGSEILPIDSEHSAIFQCLVGHEIEEVETILLSCSGGPFFNVPQSEFDSITPKKALNHPKWKMGQKITIDSATLMNKSLEIIEANTLFGIDVDRIKVLIHPDAIIHSMVQFVDGNIMAQLGVTDMKLPIQYAISYPDRIPNNFERVDFSKLSELRFFEPDHEKFPTLEYGYWAAREGGTLPTVLNAADEICVDFFLKGKISFLQIMKYLEKTMKNHKNNLKASYDDLMNADSWAREEATRLCLN